MGGRWGPRLDGSTSGQGTGIMGVMVAYGGTVSI